MSRPETKGAETAWKEAQAELRKRIKDSKRQAWKDLIQTIKQDPWGLPYKIVLNKLATQQHRATPANKEEACRVIEELFPPGDSAETPPAEAEGQEEGDTPPVTQEEIAAALKNMNSAKAPGPDGITAGFIKKLHKLAPSVLTIIFNRCLERSSFPRGWKAARLVLLPKNTPGPGERQAYRPLCLLNTVGKVYEKVLATRLEKHMEANGGLSQSHFGFRKGKSTTQALQRVTERIKRQLEAKECCVGVSLDIKNAFNSADWTRVIKAVEDHGTPRYLAKTVRQYLHERRVTYTQEEYAVSMDMTRGVPQGSVLGLQLWNIMFDDLLKQQLPFGAVTT